LDNSSYKKSRYNMKCIYRYEGIIGYDRKKGVNTPVY